jgi:hypothetical protein
MTRMTRLIANGFDRWIEQTKTATELRPWPVVCNDDYWICRKEA